MKADHGESPFSGGGLALSGSFFLPPKIPKIFCKAFFFFCPASPSAPLAPLTLAAPLASAGASGPASPEPIPPAPPPCGGVFCPRQNIGESHDPAVANRPPCSSQNCVGAEPAT